MDDRREVGALRPIVNVVAGFLAQALFLVLATTAGAVLLWVTNPAQPPEGGDSRTNRLVLPVIVVVLAGGVVPWLATSVIRLLGGLRGKGVAPAIATLLCVASFAGLLWLGFYALLLLGLTAVECAPDAYECPI